MNRKQWRFYGSIVLILDILAVTVSNMLSVWIRFNPALFGDITQGGTAHSGYYTILLFIIPMYIITNYFLKLYKIEHYRGTLKELKRIFAANLSVALMMVGFTFVIRLGWDYSRYILLLFIVFNILFSAVFRILCHFFIRRMYKKGYARKRIALIGTGRLAKEYMNSIKDYLSWGYRLEGIILTDKSKGTTGFMGYGTLGGIDDIPTLNKSHMLDEMVIALNADEAYLIKKVIRICDMEGIRVKIIPMYYEFLQVSASIEDVNGLPVMSIRETPLDFSLNRFCKRMFDIFFSLFAIIVFSPLLLITAICVKLTSPGPILFKQERVGINNKGFNMLKFRSMKVQKDEEEKTQWTTKTDPRKTKFGSIIRKLSIDELPQFFNVLMGHMSIVGPRPERPYFVDKFKSEIPEYMVRHYVKSGITGWAQVNGWRGDTSIEERIKCDNYYIQHWSLWLDIKICFLTVIGMFKKNNAY
jgi:Undecaprenyl-phosphate glucose phosphotransferase